VSPQPLELPPELQSSRIVVISDFNCPYCFTLNEWLNQLGVAERVYWVGVEHKSHLPFDFSATNQPDDHSHQALLLQAAVEADEPALAAPLRTAIFRSFWRDQRNIANAQQLHHCQQQAGVEPDPERFLDPKALARLSTWWRQELDCIPCMLAPTGARHLGLQDRAAVEAFVLGALHDPPAGPACR